MASETQTLNGQTQCTLSYAYDADGLRSDITYPNALAVEYAWTARAQLAGVSADGLPPLATYTYDKAGRNTADTHEHDRRLKQTNISAYSRFFNRRFDS